METCKSRALGFPQELSHQIQHSSKPILTIVSILLLFLPCLPATVCPFPPPAFWKNSHWANLKELKPLPEKAIKAYLEEPSHKKGKLRTGYETALDPTEWEEKISKQGVAGGMAIDEEDGGDEVDEDVDMLDEDGGEETGSKTKKRKRATGAAAAEKKEPKKKETAAKAKAPASKKRKVRVHLSYPCTLPVHTYVHILTISFSRA